MNGKTMHWVNRLAALGLAVVLTAGFAVAGGAQSVGGQAYSTYVNTPLGSSGQSPLAGLPAVSGTGGAGAGGGGRAVKRAGAPSSRFLQNNHPGGKGGPPGGRAQRRAGGGRGTPRQTGSP